MINWIDLRFFICVCPLIQVGGLFFVVVRPLRASLAHGSHLMTGQHRHSDSLRYFQLLMLLCFRFSCTIIL
jgi:hypothetical protein